MRAVKRTFGYLKTKKRNTIIRTILYFTISAAIYIAGYVTTKTRANLLTVVAVLGCLPACKSAVNMIMLIRAKGCSEQACEKIKACEGRLIGMYDMYFTSYQKNFPLSHMVVDKKVILGYTEIEKTDTDACAEHLQTMLKQGGFKDYTVTITRDIQKYCEQLKNLNQEEGGEHPEKEDEVRILLYDISL